MLLENESWFEEIYEIVHCETKQAASLKIIMYFFIIVVYSI